MLLPVACLLAVLQHVDALPYRPGFTEPEVAERWPSYDDYDRAMSEMYTPLRRAHDPALRVVFAQPPNIEETSRWRRRLASPVSKRYSIWQSVGGPLPTKLRRIIGGSYRSPASPKATESPQSQNRAMRYG